MNAHCRSVNPLSLLPSNMELCTRKAYCTNFPNTISDSQVNKCFQEYKLQDKVDALKNYLGINTRCDDTSCTRNFSDKSRSKKFGDFGVKDCLQPSVPSTFQALVTELKDTVRNSYWNKEIGKTVYLVPHLPAGCDPLETTFGKATSRDEHGVAEILNPRDYVSEDAEKKRLHALYRKSHNNYNPSEQVDRKYKAPFNKFSSHGIAQKADISGKKVAKCLEWFNPDSMTLVNRRFADYYNRSKPQLGKVKNSEMALTDVSFGKNINQDCCVADTLNECLVSQQRCPNYCSEYAEAISKNCESGEEENIAAKLPGIRNGNSSRSVVPTCGLGRDSENQTSAHALISPNIFTQMGLSHVDFFKTRDYNEIRSIYENIGIHFPGDTFDALWNEGLAKDCTGGVCVETFRNLLPKSALKNCNKESE